MTVSSQIDAAYPAITSTVQPSEVKPSVRGSSAVAGTWCAAVRRPAKVRRIVTLVDSALYGFHLDLATDRPEWLAVGVDDLATAAQRAGRSGHGSAPSWVSTRLSQTWATM